MSITFISHFQHLLILLLITSLAACGGSSGEGSTETEIRNISDSNNASIPEQPHEPTPEPQIEPEPEPQTEPELEPQTEPEPESQTEPGPEPQTEPEPESQTEPEPESQTEPEPEPQTEPEPESVIGCSHLSTDAEPPSANIDFPPKNGLVEANELTFIGTAFDNECISSVSINGVEVESDNNYLNWRVTLPLSKGENLFSLSVIDGSGNMPITPMEVTIQNTLLLDGGHAAINKSTRELFFTSNYNNRVLKYNIEFDELAVLSSNKVGTGQFLNGPVNIVIDEVSNVAYVYDYLSKRIISIDIKTGNRAIVSDNTSIGEGISFTAYARGFVFNSIAKNLIYILQFNVEDSLLELLEVNTETGDRRLLVNTDSGLTVSSVSDFLYDANNDRLIILSNNEDAIIEVDVETGKLVQIGSFPRSANISDAEYDLDNDRLLTVENGAVLSYTFSPESRNYIFPVAGETQTLDFGSLIESLLDPVGNQLFFFDNTGTSYLSKVDFNTGEFSELLNIAMGAGTSLSGGATDLVTDDRSQVIYASTGSEIIAIDLRNGNRSLISSAAQHLGNNRLRNLILDTENNRLYGHDNISGGGESIIAIEIATGDQSVVSNLNMGFGVDFYSITGLAIDTDRKKLYVSTTSSSIDDGQNAVISVDIDTGDRTILSGGDNGQGIELSRPQDLFYDIHRDRIIITSIESTITDTDIFTINVENGDRTLQVSDLSVWSVELDPYNDQLLIVPNSDTQLYFLDLNTMLYTHRSYYPINDMRMSHFAIVESGKNIVSHSSVYNALIKKSIDTGESVIFSR